MAVGFLYAHKTALAQLYAFGVNVIWISSTHEMAHVYIEQRSAGNQAYEAVVLLTKQTDHMPSPIPLVCSSKGEQTRALRGLRGLRGLLLRVSKEDVVIKEKMDRCMESLCFSLGRISTSCCALKLS